MRLSAGLIAAGLIVLAAPVFGASETDLVDGWARTRADTGCSTSYFGGPPPTLSLDINRDGKGTMSLLGLSLPKTMAEMDALNYSAVVTVKLNGKVVFTQNTSRRPGFLRLDVDLNLLRSMTEPGQIQFEFKGDGGQQETIEYASPGLASPIAFLSECVSS
jgi:hypothetical protein